MATANPPRDAGVEVYMTAIPYGVPELKVKSELAKVLHKPPFTPPGIAAVNFRFSYGNGKRGVGTSEFILCIRNECDDIRSRTTEVASAGSQFQTQISDRDF